MTLPEPVLERRTSEPLPVERISRPSLPGAVTWTSWLPRTTAATAVIASLTGVLLAPGLRGIAKNRIVEATNLLGWTFAYLMSGLLVALVVLSTLALSRRGRSYTVDVGVAASATGLVVALAVPAIFRPLPTIVAAGLAVVASVSVLAAVRRGLSAPHTRAVAAVMACFAVAGLVRIVGWNLARIAGDSGSTRLYAAARVVATLGLAFEGLGQMMAAAWLGTRSRFRGQALSSLAIGLAWIVTWAASFGIGASASPVSAAAHLALLSAAGLPQPYAPSALVSFLLAASILLSAVATLQKRQSAPVTVALCLALVGRGALDVPLRALAASAGALWLLLTSTDERALWQSVFASRALAPPGLAPPRERP